MSAIKILEERIGELELQIAEACDLLGPGGDDTLKGRIESVLSSLHESEQTRKAQHELYLDGGCLGEDGHCGVCLSCVREQLEAARAVLMAVDPLLDDGEVKQIVKRVLVETRGPLRGVGSGDHSPGVVSTSLNGEQSRFIWRDGHVDYARVAELVDDLPQVVLRGTPAKDLGWFWTSPDDPQVARFQLCWVESGTERHHFYEEISDG